MDQQPERFARIVITGGAGLKPKRKPKYYVRVGIAKFGKFVGKVRRAARPALAGPDAPARRLRGLAERLEEIRGTSATCSARICGRLLPGVTVPTLLLWGHA